MRSNLQSLKILKKIGYNRCCSFPATVRYYDVCLNSHQMPFLNIAYFVLLSREGERFNRKPPYKLYLKH